VEIVILPTAAEGAVVAADMIAELMVRRPQATLGVATGSSPQAIYRELATRVSGKTVSFAEASAYALDEYVGLPFDHPQSYHSVIAREVVEPLRFNPSRVHVPDGLAVDVRSSTVQYENAIEEGGGIDLQILGIGTNGHIGFNEPSSSFTSRTRMKTLAPQTRADNARFFDDPADVPRHCITQGLGTILGAQHLLLVAQGSGKAGAVARAVEGPVSSMCPGSMLQLHPRATVILDDAAASRLELGDYYRYVWANKPR
jgi:glucosamine-6-phosphate deaminase